MLVVWVPKEQVVKASDGDKSGEAIDDKLLGLGRDPIEVEEGVK